MTEGDENNVEQAEQLSWWHGGKKIVMADFDTPFCI
jgi:hypothetical protein